MKTTMAVAYKLEAKKPDGSEWWSALGFQHAELTEEERGHLAEWVALLRKGMSHFARTQGLTGFRWTKNGQTWDPAGDP